MQKTTNFLKGAWGGYLLLLLMIACVNKQSSNTEEGNTTTTEKETASLSVNKVITEDEQRQLTPDSVLEILKKGNEEFANGGLTIRNTPQRITEAVSGQYPKATVLACIDSRVPVEDIFHRGIGDLFVARIAGNIVNEDILGSLEYACKVSGSKLLIVLGHRHCGAVKSAIDNVQMGNNINTLLAKIRPAVEQAKAHCEGAYYSKNKKFMEAVCHENVQLTLQRIREESPILKEMEEKGEIKIIGGIYNLETGKVTFME